MQIQEITGGMLPTNCFIVTDEETGISAVIDPGFISDELFDRIKELKKVDAILLTHGHFDHVLALDEVRERFNVKAYIGNTEKAVLEDPEANLTSGFMGEGRTFSADVYLKDGEEFEAGGFRIKAFEVPGHTIGGMCYYFMDEGVLFSGDTLFCESVGRSDFKGGSTFALIASIKEKLYTLPDDVKVYPGHSEATTIGHEKKYNPFVR